MTLTNITDPGSFFRSPGSTASSLTQGVHSCSLFVLFPSLVGGLWGRWRLDVISVATWPVIKSTSTDWSSETVRPPWPSGRLRDPRSWGVVSVNYSKFHRYGTHPPHWALKSLDRPHPAGSGPRVRCDVHVLDKSSLRGEGVAFKVKATDQSHVSKSCSLPITVAPLKLSRTPARLPFPGQLLRDAPWGGG